MIQSKQIKIASIFGALSVILGAFAAHTLKENLNLSEENLMTFKTANAYQFYHVFAMFIVILLADRLSLKMSTIAFNLFCIGIVVFCGSLYLLATSELLFGTYIRWLGAITPIGGLCFIGGWVCLFLGAVIKRD